MSAPRGARKRQRPSPEWAETAAGLGSPQGDRARAEGNSHPRPWKAPFAHGLPNDAR